MSGEVHRLDDIRFEGPNLDLPSPPADLAYEDYEDWRSAELLAINGVAPDSLRDALRTQANVLLSAAAHTAGARGEQASIPELRAVAAGPDDYAAVEAAYALTRLGEADGAELLRVALRRPTGAYLSPVLAAGYLARLGDSSGFPVVREGLAGDLLATKMLACKQLYFFLPLGDVDARGLLEQAAADPDASIRAQARVQL